MRQPILLWALVTLLVWGAAYGFVSYQNLGSAFRFRVQVVPILLLLGLYLTYAPRLKPRRLLKPRTPAVPEPVPTPAPAEDSRPPAADPQG